MLLASSSLSKILDEIGDELINQISLAKNIDAKINAKKLFQQSKILNDIILTSEVTEEDKSMLQKFSMTLQDSSTAKSLRYKKQDLERVLSNLNGL